MQGPKKGKDPGQALRRPEKKLPQPPVKGSDDDKFSDKLIDVSVDSADGSQTESSSPSQRPVRKPTAII